MPEKNEKVKVSCTVLSGSANPWTAACPAPLSMEFSRQEYWSGLPFPSPEDLPNPGIKPKSPTLQADSLPPEPQGKPTIRLVVITLVGCVWDFSHEVTFKLRSEAKEALASGRKDGDEPKITGGKYSVTWFIPLENPEWKSLTQQSITQGNTL